MSSAHFAHQRQVGEALLEAGWHACSIAVASKPASAWRLSDASRRIRVHMSADLGSVLAEITSVGLPASAGTAVPWRLVIHHAPLSRIVAGTLKAPDTRTGGVGAERRCVARALEATGMRADRGRLVRALSGTACWTSPDRQSEALWRAPSRTQPGGWLVNTAAVLLEASSSTPAAVLILLVKSDPLPGGAP